MEQEGYTPDDMSVEASKKRHPTARFPGNPSTQPELPVEQSDQEPDPTNDESASNVISFPEKPQP